MAQTGEHAPQSFTGFDRLADRAVAWLAERRREAREAEAARRAENPPPLFPRKRWEAMTPEARAGLWAARDMAMDAALGSPSIMTYGAAAARLGNVGRFAAMSRRGAGDAAIRRATRYERGPFGYGVETSGDATLRPAAVFGVVREGSLGELAYIHPEVARAYPTMRDVKVEMVPSAEWADRLAAAKAASAEAGGAGSTGAYAKATDTILVKGPSETEPLHMFADRADRTLVHELQHAAQARDGILGKATGDYRTAAKEVDARNSANRRWLGPAERREMPRMNTQDVRPEEVHMDDRGGDINGRHGNFTNFLATDDVPESIFGIPVVQDEGGYTEKDLAFFKENPKAAGFYETGDEEDVESQEAWGGANTVDWVSAPATQEQQERAAYGRKLSASERRLKEATDARRALDAERKAAADADAAAYRRQVYFDAGRAAEARLMEGLNPLPLAAGGTSPFAAVAMMAPAALQAQKDLKEMGVDVVKDPDAMFNLAMMLGMLRRAPTTRVRAAEAMLEAKGTTWAKAPRKLKLEIKKATGVENYLGQWVQETQDPVLKPSVKATIESGNWDLRNQSISRRGPIENFVDLPEDLAGSKIFSRSSIELSGGPNKTAGGYGEMLPVDKSIFVETREPRALDKTGTKRRPIDNIEGTTVHEIQHLMDYSPAGLGVNKLADAAAEKYLGHYVGRPTETRAFNVEYRHRFMTPEERASTLMEDTTEALFRVDPVKREALGEKSRLYRKINASQAAKGGNTRSGTGAGETAKDVHGLVQKFKDHVRTYENRRVEPYRDVDGNWAVGYGSHFLADGTKVTPKTAVTDRMIDDAFDADLARRIDLLAGHDRKQAKFAVPNWRYMSPESRLMLLDVSWGRKDTLTEKKSPGLFRELRAAGRDTAALDDAVRRHYPSYRKATDANGAVDESKTAGLQNRRIALYRILTGEDFSYEGKKWNGETNRFEEVK